MAAIRLGTVLTNLTGTANQILRVNSGETGFEFYTPASLPAYTITNGSTDRAMNAADTTLDELANVVATLIADLGIALGVGGGGVTAFTWSNSEQVWPFEKDVGDKVIYCKRITGNMGNAGSWTSFSIGLQVASIEDFEGFVLNASGDTWYPLPTVPYSYPTANWAVTVNFSPANGGITYISLESESANYNGSPVELYVKYTKP